MPQITPPGCAPEPKHICTFWIDSYTSYRTQLNTQKIQAYLHFFVRKCLYVSRKFNLYAKYKTVLQKQPGNQF